MVLIRKYRIRKAGSRGHVVSIPNEYIEDIGIAAGQKIAMYRDEDRLVLIPERERHAEIGVYKRRPTCESSASTGC